MAEKEATAEPTADSNPQSEDMDLETLNSPAQNPMMATPPMEPRTTAIRTRSAAEKKMGKKRTMTGSGSSESGPVRLGPKEFASSVEMFDYFFNLLHFWPSQLNFNKYDHMVLLDLVKKGHIETDKKIGGGVKTFQIRNHPMWKSKCFFVIREDDPPKIIAAQTLKQTSLHKIVTGRFRKEG